MNRRRYGTIGHLVFIPFKGSDVPWTSIANRTYIIAAFVKLPLRILWISGGSWPSRTSTLIPILLRSGLVPCWGFDHWWVFVGVPEIQVFGYWSITSSIFDIVHRLILVIRVLTFSTCGNLTLWHGGLIILLVSVSKIILWIENST